MLKPVKHLKIKPSEFINTIATLNIRELYSTIVAAALQTCITTNAAFEHIIISKRELFLINIDRIESSLR